jgi:hypothetical protein
MDTGLVVESHGDAHHQFMISEMDYGLALEDRRNILEALRVSWDQFEHRAEQLDVDWFKGLIRHLDDLLDRRIFHVNSWIASNTERFTSHASTLEALYREFDALTVDMRASLKLCGMQCLHCNLMCVLQNHHDLSHDCTTSHQCTHSCTFTEEHATEEPCGLP